MTEQPMPVRNDRPSIQGMVRVDLAERERVGIQRYGTALQAGNGRDAIRDAYEEALDLATYLRQVIEERRLAAEARRPGVPSDDPTRDLIADALALHRIGIHQSDETGDYYVIYCSCGRASAGGGLWFGSWMEAGQAATRHQAEQVAEALRHGAPPVADSGADPANLHDAPTAPVRSAEEVGR